MSDSVRWQAVVSRDPAFDNVFVYAVTTTRIYCRPICKARLARRSNVEFYTTAEEAEAAGYRACKRCKPQLDCYQPEADNIRAVCERLRQLPSDAPLPGSESLARDAGLTKHHFHRLFKRETGLTPREFAIACRSGQSPATSGTSPASDPTTPGKVHHRLEQLEAGVPAATAGDQAPAAMIFYTAVETTYGLLLVVFQNENLCKLELCADGGEIVEILGRHFPDDQHVLRSIDTENGSEAKLYQRQIDAVVEALERPSGKIVDVPTTITGGFEPAP